MRKIIGDRNALAIGACALFLAGCAAQNEASEGDGAASGEGENGETTLSAESLVMAETGWLTVSAEGEVFTTYLDADGRYRDLRGGELRFGGSWQQNDRNELCFTPDAGEGECWTHRAPGLNGVMRATNRAGGAIEVKRVAYIASTSSASSPAQPSAQEAAETETPALDSEESGRG